MVNICYLIPIASLVNAMSYGLLLSKDSNYRNQLSSENVNGIGRSQYPFISPNLSKREEDSENDEISNEINDENNTSYSSRIANRKNNHSTSEFDMPDKGSISDWDDEYYDAGGKTSVYQGDSQELGEIIDHYLEMGKEKWAGFLATSSCGHFQNIIKKLKKVIGKCEGNIDRNEEDCDDSETDFKLDYKNKKIAKKPEDGDGGKDEYEYEDKIENSNQYSYELKYSKNGNIYDASKQPLFSSIIEDNFAKLQLMFSDVSKYWESKDAKDILKFANHVTYEDFEVEGEEEVFDSNFPLEKETQSHKDEILESLDPNQIKTDKQKKWLKSNALRRVNLIQQLFNGELDDEDIYETDDFHFRDGNIFLDEDENEFENMSPGFKIQSTNLALYIAFMVTEIIFIIGF